MGRLQVDSSGYRGIVTQRTRDLGKTSPRQKESVNFDARDGSFTC